MKDNLSFKNLTIDFSKLLKIGFVKENEWYKYEKKIMNDQFLLIIKIDKNKNITSDIIEISTNEKFLRYYVINSTGEYVNKIRDEYNNIIEQIKNTCCQREIYKSEYTNLIIKYIREKYHDELEYLWEKFSNTAVWRNKVNNKWYGILFIVEKSKIGIMEEGSIEIIDLLLEKEKVKLIVDNKKYFPGYHMNKKYWITIKLDGSVDINEIYKLIDNSYRLSKNKSK